MKVETIVKVELSQEESKIIARFLDEDQRDLPDEVETLMVQLPR